MAKLSKNRPADWDDKSEDGVNTQSSVSEYKSGKVQKNVVSDKSIVQEDLAEGKKKKLVSSSKVEHKTKGNIYTTYEDDTKSTHTASKAVENHFSKDYTSNTVKETSTIKAKSKNENITADKTLIDDNTLTEIATGKHSITATKKVNIKSNDATITTDKLTVTSASYKIKAKNHKEIAPHKTIKASSVKYNISNSMNMDGNLSKSSFKVQSYQTKEAEYKHPDDTNENIYYVGDVVYSPVKSRLYFVATNQARTIFDSQRKYLSNSQGTTYKHSTASRRTSCRFADNRLEQILLDNQEYIHISFIRAGMCMLDQSTLDDLDIAYIDFDRDKHLNEDNYLINWDSVNSDLLDKVKQMGFKSGFKFVNQQAIDDAIEKLQYLSETDPNRWLDIGKTKQASMLYMGLLLANRYNFFKLANTEARLPLKPDLKATIDYDNEKAVIQQSYKHETDIEFGIFELVTTEEFVDSQITLSAENKVKVEDDKYILQGKNHDKYPKDKDNLIKSAILSWVRASSIAHDDDLELIELGTLVTEDITAKQLTKPYKIELKDDKWQIYADSKYLLSSHNNNQDYPNGDALLFDATLGEHYNLEKFYYYQEAKNQFELDDDLIARTIKETLQRRASYQALLDTISVPNDDKVKEYFDSIQEDGKTKDIADVIEQLKLADDELILALVPQSVGKLLYLINNPDEDSQKALDDSEELSEEVVRMNLKLLSTFTTRKGYLKALQHYQPLNDTDEVDPEDSVKHLWEREDGLSIDNRRLERTVYGAYNKLNSEDMTLRIRANENHFEEHEFVEFKPVEIAITREADEIVADLKEEDQEDTSQPLTNLPDKDASVLCELVYEKSALDFAINIGLDKSGSLANIFYDSKKVRKADGFKLSDDFKYALENYPDYYRSILKKYKLVTTSSQFVSATQSSFVGTAPSYFAMVVAHAKDKENKGVYVINRGTIEGWDFWSDLRMGAGKLIPSPNVIPQLETGINFAQNFLDANKQVEYLNFSGHSLGGSIAQIQAVYFYDTTLMYGGQTRCFEPFGTISEVDSRVGFNIGNTYFYPNMNLLSDIQHAINWVSFGSLFNDWKGLTENLVGKYQDNQEGIKSRIINFARQGDPVAEMSGQVGHTRKLPTGTKSCYDYLPQDLRGIVAVPEVIKNSFMDNGTMYQDHRIIWYRYNQYSDDGTLIVGTTNPKNKGILQGGTCAESAGIRTYFGEVFNEKV